MTEEKKQILNEKDLKKVSGGLASANTYDTTDNRLKIWLQEQNIKLENKKIEAEIKKAWIKGGLDLAKTVLSKAIDAGLAAATSGGSEAAKAAGKVLSK